MLRNKFSLKTALEEITQETDEQLQSGDIALDDAGEQELPVSEDSPEQAISDTEAAAQDVEMLNDGIDQAVTDADSLADIADKIEKTEAEGGMTPATAEMVEVAVEALFVRLGVTNHKVIPALEAFGGESSRQKSTAFAVENIRETLKSVGQAIYAMFQKAYEFVKDFITKLFDANYKTKARAAKILQTLAKVQSDAKAKEDKVAGSFVQALTMGSEVDATKAIAAAEKLLVGAAALGDNIFTNSVKVTADISKMVSDKEAYDGFAFAGLSLEGWTDTSRKAENGASVYILKDANVGGNKQMVLQTLKGDFKGEEAFEAVAKTKVTLEKFDEVKTEGAPTLSIEDAKKLTKDTIRLCNTTDSHKKDAEAAAAFLLEMAKGVKSSSKTIDPKDSEAKSRASSVRRMLVSLKTVSSSPVLLANTVAINTAKATLDYVAKSANQYGKKEVVEA